MIHNLSLLKHHPRYAHGYLMFSMLIMLLVAWLAWSIWAALSAIQAEEGIHASMVVSTSAASVMQPLQAPFRYLQRVACSTAYTVAQLSGDASVSQCQVGFNGGAQVSIALTESGEIYGGIAWAWPCQASFCSRWVGYGVSQAQ